MNSIRLFLVLCFTFILLNLQAQGSKNKTQKTSLGLEYKIFTANSGDKIASGDLVFFKVIIKTGDSIIFNTYKNAEGPAMNLLIQDKISPANFEEGLTLLCKGDSALFLIHADSFYSIYTHSPTPDFVKKSEPLKFFVKIDSIITKATLAESKALVEQESYVKQQNESMVLEAYLKRTGLAFIRTTSGLNYLITKKTNGPKAHAGDKIAAFYTGKLLDGTVFDTNKESGQPFEFTLGAHQVIAGWDEIFEILNEGESATLVLPSSLAYGEGGTGSRIGGYSSLIFDIEFVKISKAE